MSQFKTKEKREVAKREWLLGIGKYTPVQIHNALEKCKTEYLTAPTLGQFLSCFESSKKYHQPFDRSKAITHQETDEGKAKRITYGEKYLAKAKAHAKTGYDIPPKKKADITRDPKLIEEENKVLAELGVTK